jgi:phytoene/squalene synthetase
MTLDLAKPLASLPATTRSILGSAFDDIVDAASPEVIRVMDRRISELNAKIGEREGRESRYRAALEGVEMAIEGLKNQSHASLGAIREMLYGRKQDLQRLMANDPVIGYREKRDELSRDRDLILSRARLAREMKTVIDNG